MATNAQQTPADLEARARVRARRREQAATAAARAGGMLSLAVVLLGTPAVVHHTPATGSSRASQATTARTGDDSSH